MRERVTQRTPKEQPAGNAVFMLALYAGIAGPEGDAVQQPRALVEMTEVAPLYADVLDPETGVPTGVTEPATNNLGLPARRRAKDGLMWRYEIEGAAATGPLMAEAVADFIQAFATEAGLDLTGVDVPAVTQALTAQGYPYNCLAHAAEWLDEQRENDTLPAGVTVHGTAPEPVV